MWQRGHARKTPPIPATVAKMRVMRSQGMASSRITSPLDAPSAPLNAIPARSSRQAAPVFSKPAYTDSELLRLCKRKPRPTSVPPKIELTKQYTLGFQVKVYVLREKGKKGEELVDWRVRGPSPRGATPRVCKSSSGLTEFLLGFD